MANEDGTITYTAYSDEEMATEALYTYTLWDADWTEYKFDATKGGETTSTSGDAYYFWIFSDGTTMFGTEGDYENLKTAGQTGGATGYWGYMDGELTFVKASATGVTPNADGGYDITYSYYVCTTTTSGDSVTVTTPDDSPYVATITDIGCLAGKEGYDLSTIEIATD